MPISGKEQNTENKVRPPIVVVMGHVDHGKTTLLDYIRKTETAAKEAGGITQAIGAYEVMHGGEKLSFIDTPGHEAFSKMRSHGARVADIAVLVVAADDGVKPQTREALEHIRNAHIPFMVAMNKIDKPGASLEKTKSDLLNAGVFLEGSGGDIPWQAISAKTGEGVSPLLDLLLLIAELEHLAYDPKAAPTGVVLTSRRDPQRGNTVGVVVKNGVLQSGMFIATASTIGKVKILENFLGKTVPCLQGGAPARIIGFERLPDIGETFVAYQTEAEARLLAQETEKHSLTPPESPPVEHALRPTPDGTGLRLVLKADEAGSLEALTHLITGFADFPCFILHASVGDVHETDVKLAIASNAIIVGFRTKVERGALTLGRARRVVILTSPIIYELEKQLVVYKKKATLSEVRSIEVLATFKSAPGKERVVGGRVVQGPVKNQESFEVWQDGKPIGAGKILNLQSGRQDIKEAETGQEVGLLVGSEEPVKVGNKLVFAG